MRSLGRRSLVLSVVIGLLGGMLPASPAAAAAPALSTHTIASGLVIPWDVAFVPDGTMLVTERPGRIRVYSSGGTDATLVRTITVPGVTASGEAGLMGIAVDVDFASNGYVYVCASRTVSGAWRNQVLRYRIAANGTWANPIVLNIGTMVANTIHNGCAVEMDRFGKLWITMGDANNTALAQNRNSLNGKILRVNRDGSIPSDNPVIGGKRDRVYSMGHRNPQGIGFQPGTDRVYAVEHGPQPSHGDDEINLIVAGGNYGWPCYTGYGRPWGTISGGCPAASAYRNPVWSSGAGVTLATSGGAFMWGSQWADWNGQFFVSNLKESDIRRFSLNATGTTMTMQQTLFNNSWGRLRAMVSGPGGQMYVTTSMGSNDRVIRIRPAASSVTRIAGPNRYATAAQLSRSAYPGGAASVMVATGANFPDALAGSAAAGHLGMPVLLVTRDSIPAATATELDQLDPDTIFVLGGEAVISESVRTRLESYASTGVAERLAGANRYATAAAISSKWYSPGVAAAFVANGDGFADALAGAPASALRESPLLLVSQGSIPAATATELDLLNPGRIYVLGGTSMVSASVATQLAAYGPVTRLAGANRFATAAAITSAFWTRTDGYVATGHGFADALTGGAIAGLRGQPMLLVDKGSVPWVIGQEVLQFGSRQLTILGGTAVVPTSAENVLKRLVGTP